MCNTELNKNLLKPIDIKVPGCFMLATYEKASHLPMTDGYSSPLRVLCVLDAMTIFGQDAATDINEGSVD